MSGKLVAYFSASGTTRNVAQVMAEAAEADLYEIRPAVPYTTKDLNWMNPFARSTKEMKKKIHPEIITGDIDMGAYDTVFLGFPIWWYVAPTVINSFLESYDFSGKKIILFATSGGSGFGKTKAGLKASVAADCEIIEGRLLNGGVSAESLKTWIGGLHV